MDAITTKYPFSELILAGVKISENRSRPTAYRGPLLIHVAQQNYEFWKNACGSPKALLLAKSHIQKQTCAYFGKPPAHNGCVAGIVYLVDCTRENFSPFCQSGQWHYKLLYPTKFIKPLPFRGNLGIYKVPSNAISAASYIIARKYYDNWNSSYNQQLELEQRNEDELAIFDPPRDPAKAPAAAICENELNLLKRHMSAIHPPATEEQSDVTL